MVDSIRKAFLDAREVLDKLINDEHTITVIEAVAQKMVKAFRENHRVFSCGNGGSMCDAMHFAEELTGRFRENRAPLPAMAISDSGYLSCTANDYGYDEVFARFVLAHGQPGDVLLGISTSGKSPNVIKAAKVAKEKGLVVVALTGKPGTVLAELADYTICTPGKEYADRVQELHIKVIHVLIERIEALLMAK